jgi:hypothetical protein
MCFLSGACFIGQDSRSFERSIVKILMAGGLLAVSAILGGCAVVPAYPEPVVSGGVYVNQPPVVVAPAYGYAYPAYPGYRYRHHRRHW